MTTPSVTPLPEEVPERRDRMAGGVGFDDLPEAWRRKDWFELRSKLRSEDATDDDVRAWIADGCPRRRAEAYTAFFFELDAWSEYWDVYHPETKGLYHFGDGSQAGDLSAFLPGPGEMRSPVFDAWKAYALASRDEENAPEAKRRFEQEVERRPEMAEAAPAVDELVSRLVREHFARPDGSLDADAYFDALERFAVDTLPACPDRFALIASDDPRKASSISHTVAGDIMWFAWAVHLECAQLVAPATDEMRALLMAGVALGCSMDYAFLGRCRTRAEYQSRDGAAWSKIWARARECVRDFDRAAAEVRELFFIRAYGD